MKVNIHNETHANVSVEHKDGELNVTVTPSPGKPSNPSELLSTLQKGIVECNYSGVLSQAQAKRQAIRAHFLRGDEGPTPYLPTGRTRIGVAISDLLQIIDPNPEREGLKETPLRVAKAWQHWTRGYEVDIAKLLSTQFKDGSEGYDEMVMVKDIPIYSKCEHHLADIFGTATIAYIPNGTGVLGLSKLSRLADAFSGRLQTQERITAQIADALVEHVKPKGVGVIIKARHMCMESRGICQQGHHTVTSALRGVLLDGTPRAEFMSLAQGK